MPVANELFPERAFPTPLLNDVVFYVLRDELYPKNKDRDYGQAYPDKLKWPHHELCYVSAADASGKFQWWYAAKRENQDLYNYEFTDADIGGTKFPAVKRSYVYHRKDFDPATPTMGAAMPNVPENLFGAGSGGAPDVITGYVLALREEARIGEKELDALFITEQRIYIQRCIINEIGVDPLNGSTLYSYSYLYYNTEVVTGAVTATALLADPSNAYWGLQSTGFQVSGKRLTANWILVTHEQVVGGTITGGGVTIDSYTSNDNYYWPPVLDTYELLDWERNDGSFDYFPAIRFAPEGYNGPCITTTTRTWSVSPVAIPVVEQMLPTRIYYAAPFFTANIPECLHIKIGFQCDIGNTDTTYAENAGSTRYFSATNFTSWPATIVAADDQQPFRGGYLRTRKVVTRPVAPAQVNWTTGA